MYSFINIVIARGFAFLFFGNFLKMYLLTWRDKYTQSKKVLRLRPEPYSLLQREINILNEYIFLGIFLEYMAPFATPKY